MSDIQEDIELALGWPRLRDETLAAVEAAVIEETGDGELAAYLVKWLSTPETKTKQIEDAFEAVIAKSIELDRPINARATMVYWHECRDAGASALIGVEEASQ